MLLEVLLCIFHQCPDMTGDPQKAKVYLIPGHRPLRVDSSPE